MRWWERRLPWTKVAEPVIVATRSGQVIKGVALVIAADGMVITAAKIAGTGQNATITWSPLAGEVVIPGDNVDYWQRAIGQEMIE